MSVPNEYFLPTCWAVALVVLSLLLSKYLHKRNVACGNTLAISLPPAQALVTIDRVLADKHGCKLLGKEEMLRIYTRGNRGVLKAKNHQMQPWQELPVVIIVRCYSEEPGRTHVRMTHLSWDGVSMTLEAVATFCKMAKRECLEVRQQAEDEAARAASPPAASKSPDLGAAYAALGLEPGAPWADVQAAYRTVLNNYRPGTLAELKLPAHLAELAVREGNAKAAAFRAIKAHYSAQHGRLSGMNGRESNQELHTSS
ncbi:Dna-J like membrane chaperone protein [Phycisphaerae bacterium RAS1]|nr:Dna-J like membrane chaperone protein [Phycisphaerae bacterium RAS1]